MNNRIRPDRFEPGFMPVIKFVDIGALFYQRLRVRRAKKRYLCFGTELLDYARHRQRQNDIAKAVRAAYEDLTHFQRFSGRFSV